MVIMPHVVLSLSMCHLEHDKLRTSTIYYYLYIYIYISVCVVPLFLARLNSVTSFQICFESDRNKTRRARPLAPTTCALPDRVRLHERLVSLPAQLSLLVQELPEAADPPSAVHVLRAALTPDGRSTRSTPSGDQGESG